MMSVLPNGGPFYLRHWLPCHVALDDVSATEWRVNNRSPSRKSPQLHSMMSVLPNGGDEGE